MLVSVILTGNILLANIDGRALRGGRPDREWEDAGVPRSVGATPQVLSLLPFSCTGGGKGKISVTRACPERR